uniref:U-box domain-containing protein 13-like n=1 Tax=Erigeron canadensis TaxID=72917 RepID=UPI001CB8F05A|nr:U-box domain-containing protein 13-like [Erigeron canadensis]
MAKLQQNNNDQFNFWSSCRRKIIETMKCSGTISCHKKTVKSQVITDQNQPQEMIKTSVDVKGATENLLMLFRISSLEEENVKLKEVVKKLQSGENEHVLQGAKQVRELAKEDLENRKKLGLLGVIPPLVGMLDSKDCHSHIAALYALLNLGIGNDMNKSAIVEAGALHKMLDLVKSPKEGMPDPDLSAVVVANFLGLSALDSNKPIVGSSGAVVFLIKTLKSFTKPNNSQVVQDSLRALYNLSILPSNILLMVEVENFVPFLFTMIVEIEASDRVLSVLSNIVSTPEGRKAVSMVQDAFKILVDVLNWVDSPGCQEKATYVLMIMAHKSYVDRQAMIDAGIMSSLLELTLIGSALSQKRSSKILEILRANKGKRVSGAGTTLSAPLCGSTDTESVDSSKRFLNNNAVKHLVEQSLHNNMRRIVKRANIPKEFMLLEHSKSSVASFSTSKSLPF